MNNTQPAQAQGDDVLYLHRVSYGETDCMGILYYAEYLHIFERARTSFTHARGLSYKEVETRGIYLPVREALCRYRSPARYDDLLTVACRVVKPRRASFTFAYRILDESGAALLAEGWTEHACTDAQAKPVAAPDWFRRAFFPPA
ncbi:MAG: acyl-CoA thioesterase [Desulfovibrio sp.]|jgi:acyl-CoA thioester hydrolase|nr:acyl-CoA thioesterase [Desulfovibrio sp.]